MKSPPSNLGYPGNTLMGFALAAGFASEAAAVFRKPSRDTFRTKTVRIVVPARWELTAPLSPCSVSHLGPSTPSLFKVDCPLQSLLTPYRRYIVVDIEIMQVKQGTNGTGALLVCHPPQRAPEYLPTSNYHAESLLNVDVGLTQKRVECVLARCLILPCVRLEQVFRVRVRAVRNKVETLLFCNPFNRLDNLHFFHVTESFVAPGELAEKPKNLKWRSQRPLTLQSYARLVQEQKRVGFFVASLEEGISSSGRRPHSPPPERLVAAT